MKNKIVIVGISASGKSTFARRLSTKTGLPLTFMDSIMWKPNWEYVGDEETSNKIKDVVSGDKWIIEGYVVKDVRDLVFEKADVIIYLDYSPLVSSWRYIKRCWKYRTNPRPELEGSPEKFSWKFLKIVWTKGEAISLNKYLDRVKDQSKIVRLGFPKDITLDIN